MCDYDCRKFIVDEDDDDDDDDPKNCFKSAQNWIYCSLGYGYTYIGTPNFRVKVLWVYSNLKSDFFRPKVTKFTPD